jgi:hypothetical protein
MKYCTLAQHIGITGIGPRYYAMHPEFQRDGF